MRSDAVAGRLVPQCAQVRLAPPVVPTPPTTITSFKWNPTLYQTTKQSGFIYNLFVYLIIHIYISMYV